MKRYLNQTVSVGLLLLYTGSQLLMLIASIGCRVSTLFWLWAALLCLTAWITTGTRRGWLVGLPASVLLLCFAFYVFPPNLNEQLNDAFDRLTGAYLVQIVYPGSRYEYLNLASDHSLLFLFLAFLLASYMGAALSSRSGRVGLSLLGSVPLFAACLAVTITPPVEAVFGMLLFWLLLVVGGGHYEETADSYRSVLCCLLPLGLLLGLLIWRINPSQYQYEPTQFDLTETFDQWLQDLDAKWSESVSDSRMSRLEPVSPVSDTGNSSPAESIWQDSSGNLELSKSLDRETAEHAFLRVRTEKDSLLYLRKRSYGDYLGSAWAQAEEGWVSSSLSYVAQALSSDGTMQSQVQIQELEESSCLYLPYFSTADGGYDAYVPSTRQTSYTAFHMLFPSSFSAYSVPEALREQELQYRAYAHEVYTRLPEQTRSSLYTLCQQAGLTESDNLIRDVAAYVQQTGQYSLETEPYPSNDYAVYFLTVAREGCCIHFATAAAALYRCLGVPARVTEGFLINTEGGRFTEVRGSNAHAWVEIYRDGLGWLPVEVTGQSGVDSPALGASQATPEPSPEAQPSDHGASVDSSPVPLMPVETVPPSLPVGLLTQDALEEAESNAHQGMSAFALPLWLLLTLLLLVPLPLRRSLLLYLRRRSFEQTDPGSAVIAMYRSARRAAAYGFDVPPELIGYAEKAAFSRDGVTPRERDRSRAVYDRFIRETAQTLKPLPRFRFRWFTALQ